MRILILGFCRPRSSAQCLLTATINIQVQCPVLLWGYNLNWCVMIPEIASVLMMPPSHSHYSLEGEDRGRDEKVGKFCRDGLLGCGDEVRVSVWEES